MMEVPKALPTKRGKPADPGSVILGLTSLKNHLKRLYHIGLQNQGSCNIVAMMDCVLLQSYCNTVCYWNPHKIK